MKKILFILFILLSLFSVYSREYFFYNPLSSNGFPGEKISLNQVPQFISIKFNNEVEESVQNMIIQNVFGSNLEHKDIFRVVQQNGIKSNTFIIKLKNSVDQQTVNSITSQLFSSNQVRYVGKAFSKNDKVIHLITDEVIVKFKNNVSEIDIQNLNHLFNTSVVVPVYPKDNIYLLSINSKGEPGKDNVFDVSNKYTLTHLVDYAQPNFIRIGMLLFVPNDSLLPMMWNIKNTGNNYPDTNVHSISTGCDLNLEPAWNITYGNHKVIMGIIDTGVDTGHVDLKGNLCDRSLWYNAVEENGFPIDSFNHGTAQCGIAGAVGNNFIGTCGLAWNCSIMPVQVFSGTGYTTDLILGKGLNWAWMHGADALNNSWGGGINTPYITNAIHNAKLYGRNGKGAVIIAGTGNVDSAGVYYPAVLPDVIGVGGISPCFERKTHSSCDGENWGADYGEGLSVVAPCTGIYCTTIDGYWHFYCDGTSAATSHITAIAALILSKDINLSSDSVRIIIERNSRKVGNYSYNIYKPNGMWNNEMGYGLPDAKACLDATPQGPNIVYDQIPPIIKITPPQSGVYRQPIVVSANITDNQLVAGGINLPRLYYNIPPSSLTYIIPGNYSGNNIYNFTIPNSGPGLSYGMKILYYIAAQDTSSNGNITTYPIGGRGVNPPGTVAPPKKLFLQNTNYYDTTIFNSDSIKFNAVAETTVVSYINCQTYKTVLGVRCLININHNYDEDISVSLTSPFGTETVLTGGLGHGGHGYIFTNFDDYAQNSIQDTGFHAPYTGTFSPVEKLWLMNGESALGMWKLKIVDNSTGDTGSLNLWSIKLRFSTDRDNSQVPLSFQLFNNYPNPFNPVTRIRYSVPFRSKIKIIIYDILGKEVYKLLDGFEEAGYFNYVDFDMNSVTLDGGRGLASGVYFYSMYANDKLIDSKRMVLLK